MDLEVVMKIIKFSLLALLLGGASVQAATCPDPNNSPLQWGEIPPPWQLNPFSENRPQGEKGTQFIKANILVAGFGRGVVCIYKNSVGFYSIWWQVNVKMPARIDKYWRDTLGGYECTTSLDVCIFYPA
jgi:hypothetical protein